MGKLLALVFIRKTVGEGERGPTAVVEYVAVAEMQKKIWGIC